MLDIKIVWVVDVEKWVKIMLSYSFLKDFTRAPTMKDLGLSVIILI